MSWCVQVEDDALTPSSDMLEVDTDDLADGGRCHLDRKLVGVLGRLAKMGALLKGAGSIVPRTSVIGSDFRRPAEGRGAPGRRARCSARASSARKSHSELPIPSRPPQIRRTPQPIRTITAIVTVRSR